jgi:hypothetical protein
MVYAKEIRDLVSLEEDAIAKGMKAITHPINATKELRTLLSIVGDAIAAGKACCLVPSPLRHDDKRKDGLEVWTTGVKEFRARKRDILAGISRKKRDE